VRKKFPARKLFRLSLLHHVFSFHTLHYFLGTAYNVLRIRKVAEGNLGEAFDFPFIRCYVTEGQGCGATAEFGLADIIFSI